MKFNLVELAEGTAGKFDGMEVSQSFWGGPLNTNLEVAEKRPTEKNSRSRQRSAKRTKSREQKVGDTASISSDKPRRIRRNASGYLGFVPKAKGR